LRIAVPGNSGCWNSENDPSFKGLSKTSEFKKAEYIPVYEYGVKVAGIEPEGTVVQPSPSPTPTPTPPHSDDVLYGDINNDKTVNSTDVTYLKRFLLKQINSLPIKSSGCKPGRQYKFYRPCYFEKIRSAWN